MSKIRRTNEEVYGKTYPNMFISHSKEEKVISSLLHELKINHICSDRKILSGKELDFYLPQLNKAIEYNGNHWHDKTLWLNDLKSHTFDSKEAYKTLLCKSLNITLYHIWEDEWRLLNEEEKTEYLKSILLK